MNLNRDPLQLSVLCGVVVTYQPDEVVTDNLAAMVRECGRLLVVDNGSALEIQQRLAAVPGVELLALGGNEGVAAALNRGLLRAEALGCRWVVMFDQDSQPRPGLVEALLASSTAGGDSLAVVGANTIDSRFPGRLELWPIAGRNRFVLRKSRCTTADLTGVATVITSGALVSLRVWRAVGGFDEALFIDYVDHDFCLRARAAGFEIRVSAAARLIHSLGAKRSVRVLGRGFTPTFHSPLRHYFMARNRIIVWKRYVWRFPYWVIFDGSDVARNWVRIAVAEDQKIKKLWAIVRGTCAGICLSFRGRRYWVNPLQERAPAFEGRRA
ncbi:MAG: glycosyltransferase family 2 protein [Opitutus sp.]